MTARIYPGSSQPPAVVCKYCRKLVLSKRLLQHLKEFHPMRVNITHKKGNTPMPEKKPSVPVVSVVPTDFLISGLRVVGYQPVSPEHQRGLYLYQNKVTGRRLLVTDTGSGDSEIFVNIPIGENPFKLKDILSGLDRAYPAMKERNEEDEEDEEYADDEDYDL